MKDKSTVPVALFFLVVCSLLPAQEKPRLSVLDFKGSGISAGEIHLFVDYITNHIVATGDYRVIDRSQRRNILKEIEFSLEGCTDEACQLEVGRLLSANFVITGSLGKLGEQFILNMKLLDVETGETLRSVSEVYANLEELTRDSGRLSLLVLGKGSNEKRAEPEREKQSAVQAPPPKEIDDESRPNTLNAGIAYVFPEEDFITSKIQVLLRFDRLISSWFGANVLVYYRHGELLKALGACIGPTIRMGPVRLCPAAGIALIGYFGGDQMMMGTDFSIAAGVLFDIGNYCLSIDFTSTLGCLSLGAGLGMNF